MKIDDFLFEPCGYSMNGILKNVSSQRSMFKDFLSKSFFIQDSSDSGLGEYMTIHITPEPEFSYVSFETNSPMVSYIKVSANCSFQRSILNKENCDVTMLRVPKLPNLLPTSIGTVRY